jgi:S1-C subfamily serine protease
MRAAGLRRGVYWLALAAVMLGVALALPAEGTPARPSDGREPARPDVYRKVLRSTALILVRRGGDSSARGTGWVADAGRRLVVTNWHVVRNAREVRVCFPRYERGVLVTAYRAYRKGPSISGRVLVSDPRRDLAVVQLVRLPQGVPALPLAEAGPRPGQMVHSVGNGFVGTTGTLWRYHRGKVRRVGHRELVWRDGHRVEARLVESYAVSGPGDSGGAIVDDAGRVVAVTSSSNGEVGTGIEVSEVKVLLKRLGKHAGSAAQ